MDEHRAMGKLRRNIIDAIDASDSATASRPSPSLTS